MEHDSDRAKKLSDSAETDTSRRWEKPGFTVATPLITAGAGSGGDDGEGNGPPTS